MSVVCGTDFSESANLAAGAAAAIAERLGVSLYLVHAVPEWSYEASGDERDGLLSAARRTLESQVRRLQQGGRQIEGRVEAFPPDAALILTAQEASASLIVVAVTRPDRGFAGSVGRTVDRLAQESPVPVLVARESGALGQWARGERPLKVMVALDFDRASESAWRWAQGLAGIAAVNLVGAHVYWPPREFGRLGLSGLRSYLEPDAEVERALRRELGQRFRPSIAGDCSFILMPGLGGPSEHLLALARKEKPDLLVVGTHRRSGFSRIWQGSVSRAVLHDADRSVVSVPLATGSVEQPNPDFQSALVATDFSPAGNAAVPYAYAQVPRGGTVYLVHIIEPIERRHGIEPRDIFEASVASSEIRSKAEERLRGMVPVRAVLGEKATEIRVLESTHVAEAIAQAANRLGVDVICLGTRGLGAVGQEVLGSVAHALLPKTWRPVLLVRAPRE